MQTNNPTGLRTSLSFLTLSFFFATPAFAQDRLQLLMTQDWQASSFEEKVSNLRAGLNARSDESRSLALIGIARLTAEGRLAAQAEFPPTEVHPLLRDTNANVAKAAARAYVALVDDDAKAEADIVEAAVRGGGALLPADYVRYLRPGGISSDAATTWLMGMAQSPVVVERYLAVETLVQGLKNPPPALLNHVMTLIRSPEYFCDANLVVNLPKFGKAAAAHLPELEALNRTLNYQSGLTPAERTVTLRVEASIAMVLMNETISTLRRHGL